MSTLTSPRFKENAKEGLADAQLQRALRNAGGGFIESRRLVAEKLPEFEALPDSARDIKNHTLANLAEAQLDLERAVIRAPVNGIVTNLELRPGDYLSAGHQALAMLDRDSLHVDGYFEESNIGQIQVGDPTKVKLIGYAKPLQGHVESIARGITVPNAEAGQSGLAKVNPIYTWVRLAQRIPVRVHIDHVPPGVDLVAGQTATVEIDSRRSS